MGRPYNTAMHADPGLVSVFSTGMTPRRVQNYLQLSATPALGR
jgi:hypothetical protein